MTKGIFIDLDGTLLDNKKSVSDYDKQVIGEIIALGHKVFLITGKSLQNALPTYLELGLTTPIITSMGQVITNPSDKSFQPIISIGKYEEILYAIQEIGKKIEIKNYLFETFDGPIYVEKCNDSNLIHLISEKGNPITLAEHQSLKEVIGSYVEIAETNQKDLGQLVSELNYQYENQFEFSYWLTDGDLPIINIKPEHVGKSVAVQKIMKLENLNYSISFGNGWNDRNMLLTTDESFAMINSTDKIKSYAKSITEFDNNNSGVGVELAKIFGLNIKK